MSNVKYLFEGDTGIGILPDGTRFLFDADAYDLIRDTKWYRNYREPGKRKLYLIDRHANCMHKLLCECPDGYEVDHINGDTLDNRRANLRAVTHQQNMINRDANKGSATGVCGVAPYMETGKYRARIKVSQYDIHLGLYEDLEEAVQARNIAMECMFGEYARYNDVPEPPDWLRDKVEKQCRRFADLSVCEAFSA